MTPLQRLLLALVAAAVPEHFRDALLGDLREGLVAQRVEASSTRATLWLLTEVLTTPYLALRRQARAATGPTAVETSAKKPRIPGSFATSDLKIAARSLRKRPMFSGVAVATLTMSVGVATLIFSVLEGVLLRPLPYPDSDRIYRTFTTNEEWRTSDNDLLRTNWDGLFVSLDLIEAWRAAGGPLESVAGFMTTAQRVEVPDLPLEELSGAWVTDGFFTTLSSTPRLGRLPTTEELETGEPVIVLSDGLFSRVFAGDQAALGREIHIAGRPLAVIGVMAADFAVPTEASEWWSPLPSEFLEGQKAAFILEGLVRISPEVDAVDAADLLASIPEAIAETDPTFAPVGVAISPLRDEVVEDVSRGLLILFGAAGIVVMIACVNLSNLVLARGADRKAELAMRAALGASRGRLVMVVLYETALLALVGGALGVLITTSLLGPLVSFLSSMLPDFPRAANISLNVSVLTFSLATAIASAVVASLIPGLLASRRAPWEALQGARKRGGGRDLRRTQRSLLAAEAALAVALLSGAGLLVRSTVHVAGLDPGFEAQEIGFVEIEPSEAQYPEAADADRLVTQVVARLRAMPGVTSASRSETLPALGGATMNLIRPELSEPGANVLRAQVSVGEGYFETMGIPILRGRAFGPEDRAGTEGVAVLSEALARELYGDRDPVGESLWVGSNTRFVGGEVMAESEEAVRVVGVARDVRQIALIREAEAMIYLSLTQRPRRRQTLAIRGGDEALEQNVVQGREAVAQEDRSTLIRSSGLLWPAIHRLMAPLRVRMVLLVALAGLAVLLALVGIYGVVAHVVSSNAREIGIRMALGSRARGESWRMVREALLPTLFGGTLGVGVALVLVRAAEESLFGVGASDPVTHLGVLLLLTVMAGAAAWLPARRTAGVHPVEVLRGD